MRRGDAGREERYQQLVQHAPDGIVIHDGSRIILANEAAIRLAGATRRTQLVGQPIEAFFDPPYLKAIQSQITDAVIPKEPAPPVRDTLHRLDGSEVEVEVRAVAFMDHGRPAAHLVIRDISERLAAESATRQMEDRLQQAQRMETVGALAGGVAHEVNNMMQVIIGLSEFLLEDKRIPAECLSEVREVIRAADRASAITGQLLSFSRRAAFRPEVVDLGAVVRDAELAVRGLLGDGQSLALIAGVSPLVWADPGQLQQVLINLALNARDAMPDGGILSITTAEVQVLEGIPASSGVSVPPGRYASIAIGDTGTGIAPEVEAHIFEPFFTTKPVGEGTGLGLAAVHGLLTQNRGYITVAGAPGLGTTFTVYLPCLSPEFADGPTAD